ncbi:MAG TPA: DUF721 domain-containing protein, partial [Gaiellaceae bacterium]|nr:DUF721 domain-containing protein [Gaiellaceae bacterium]
MERLGEEIARALDRTGGGGGRALAAVVEAWPAAVGEAVARQAWPQRLGRDGTLHVAASSATWAFELDRLAHELAARLRDVLGDAAPRAVRVRVGAVPEPVSPVGGAG